MQRRWWSLSALRDDLSAHICHEARCGSTSSRTWESLHFQRVLPESFVLFVEEQRSSASVAGVDQHVQRQGCAADGSEVWRLRLATSFR